MSLLTSLMAGHAESLKQLFHLRQAKSSIETLQIEMVQHGREITEPELPANAWRGTTADKYDEKCDEASRSFNLITNSLLYGENIGPKLEAGVGKVEVSHENSPTSGSFNFGQVEAKTNYEDYTINAGASATAVKIELKVEPLNLRLRTS